MRRDLNAPKKPNKTRVFRKRRNFFDLDDFDAITEAGLGAVDEPKK